jgi:hypothetical protein
MPAIAAKSSDWPFPAAPATPTISPALIEKLTSCSPGPVSSSTSNTGVPDTVATRFAWGGRASPNHQLGEALGVRCRCVECGDDAAGAHHADPVGDRENPLQLMGYQQNGPAPRRRAGAAR